MDKQTMDRNLRDIFGTAAFPLRKEEKAVLAHALDTLQRFAEMTGRQIENTVQFHAAKVLADEGHRDPLMMSAVLLLGIHDARPASPAPQLDRVLAGLAARLDRAALSDKPDALKNETPLLRAGALAWHTAQLEGLYKQYGGKNLEDTVDILVFMPGGKRDLQSLNVGQLLRRAHAGITASVMPAMENQPDTRLKTRFLKSYVALGRHAVRKAKPAPDIALQLALKQKPKGSA